MTSVGAVIGGHSLVNVLKRVNLRHEVGGIGTWEVEIDDLTGASGLLACGDEATELSINETNIMQGYLDDKFPTVNSQDAILAKTARLVGRNYGRDLANLFITKKYSSLTKIDDLFEDALDVAGSELVYASQSSGAVLEAEFNNTYLQTGFVDAAKLVDYDFNVFNDKTFSCWALADAPDSGVLLKSVTNDVESNILAFDPQTEASVDLKNYVSVNGGSLKDHWTEGNAQDWVTENCTANDDSEVYISGQQSIRATILSNNQTAIYVEFPNVKFNQPILDLSDVPEVDCRIRLARDCSSLLQLYAKDDQNNEILCHVDVPTVSKWSSEITFKMGYAVPFGGTKIGEWWYLSGSNFTWKISRIGVLIQIPGSSSVNKHFWIDGLEIPNVAVLAYSEDSTSQSTYGKRMLSINRTDVKSQNQLQAIANSELANRKNPTNKLTLTCTFQPTLLYAGYLVEVRAPYSGIGTAEEGEKYRVLSVEHTAEPGTNLYRGHDAITKLELIKYIQATPAADPSRYQLANNSQAVINTHFEQRLNVLEKTVNPTANGTNTSSSYPQNPAFQNVAIDAACTVSATSPYMTDQQIVDCIAKWDEYGVWAPDPFPETTAKIVFQDKNTLNYANLFLVISEENGDHDDMPLLVCDQGFVVKKDLAVGGYISANQGALYLGSRMGGAGDPPKIKLMHSELGYDTLFIHKMDGTNANLAAATLSLDSPNNPVVNFKKSGATEAVIYHDDDALIVSSTTGNISFASATGHIDPYAANYSLGYYTPFADVYATNLHGALTDVQALNVLPRGTSGYVLTAQGAGSAPVWAAPQTTTTRSGVTDFWNTPFWSNIPDKPSTYTPSSHNHAASDINSGRLSLTQLPDGTSGYVLTGQGAGSNPQYVDVVNLLPQGLNEADSPEFAGLYIGSAHLQYIATSPAHLYFDTSLDLYGDLNADHVSATTTLGTGEFLNLGSAVFQYVATPPAHVYLDTPLQVTDFNSTNASVSGTLYAGTFNLGSASIQYVATPPAHVYINTSLQVATDLNASNASITNTLYAGAITLGSASLQYVAAAPAHLYFGTSLQLNGYLNATAISVGAEVGITGTAINCDDYYDHTGGGSAVFHGNLTGNAASADEVAWSDITDKPSTYTPAAHNQSRSTITDFFSSSFWSNIPDKPSTFTPTTHASNHAYGGSDQVLPQPLGTGNSPTFAGLTCGSAVFQGNVGATGTVTASGYVSGAYSGVSTTINWYDMYGAEHYIGIVGGIIVAAQ